MEERKSSARMRRRRKAQRNAVLAVVAFIVAVVGIIGIVAVAGGRKSRSVSENTDVKESHLQTGSEQQNNENGQNENGSPGGANSGDNGDSSSENETSDSGTEAGGGANQDGEVTGVSARGYEIRIIDGVSYVNGILIANKTYSLPSDYNPGKIDDTVMDAFYEMQSAAAAEGLNLYISSGFRSYNTQYWLYNNYVERDGKEEADTYSARAGYSEHQTGLCFDLNTIDESFAYTPESKWLEQHAQEYGFIIRYPKGKENITGYMYDPWHLRYLGKELAEKVYNSGLCLEEYLGITSVYSD